MFLKKFTEDQKFPPDQIDESANLDQAKNEDTCGKAVSQELNLQSSLSSVGFKQKLKHETESHNQELFQKLLGELINLKKEVASLKTQEKESAENR